MRSNGVWWFARNVTVVAVVSAGGVWSVLWMFTGAPHLGVVAGWAVSVGLLSVWADAATGRRVDTESRVLRPGHRNGRPQ